MEHYHFNAVWRTPLLIVVIYATLGCAWILGSDYWEYQFAQNRFDANMFQTIKGLFFVFSTSLIIFYLIYQQTRKAANYALLLKNKNHLFNILLDSVKGLKMVVFDKSMSILIGQGGDKIFGHYSNQQLANLRIPDFKNELGWYSDLLKIYKSTLTYGHHQCSLFINEQWYEVQGKTVHFDDTKSTLVVLFFMDKSEQKELLELNQSFQDESKELNAKLEKCRELHSTAKEKQTALFDMLPFPAVISTLHDFKMGQIMEVNGLAARLFDNNDGRLAYMTLSDLLVFETPDEAQRFGAHNYAEQSNAVFKIRLRQHDEDNVYDIVSKSVQWGGEKYILCTLMAVADGPCC